MDLSAYLISRVIAATTPPGETAAEAQARAEAIAEMLRAYDPDNGMEAMMACQCIMMQSLLDAAMRDANNPRQEPAALAKARAAAISASRTLHQWVSKLENLRKRNERRAAEAAKAQAAPQPPRPTLPAAPLAPSPAMAADPPASPTPAPNGRGTPATPPPALMPADAADTVPSAVARQSEPGPRRHLPPAAAQGTEAVAA